MRLSLWPADSLYKKAPIRKLRKHQIYKNSNNFCRCFQFAGVCTGCVALSENSLRQPTMQLWNSRPFTEKDSRPSIKTLITSKKVTTPQELGVCYDIYRPNQTFDLFKIFKMYLKVMASSGRFEFQLGSILWLNMDYSKCDLKLLWVKHAQTMSKPIEYLFQPRAFWPSFFRSKSGARFPSVFLLKALPRHRSASARWQHRL